MRVQSVHVVHNYPAFIPAPPCLQLKVVDSLDKLKTRCPQCPQATRPPAKKKKQTARMLAALSVDKSTMPTSASYKLVTTNLLEFCLPA